MAQPDILTVPFGENADSGTIKEIPIVKGPTDPEQQATWSKGFPEITMRPILSGGIPPRGPDFNGVLHAISEHTVYQNGGGKYKWSQEWVDAHGGYEKGATLQDDAGEYEYVSTINNNTINFNTTPSAIGNQWVHASVATDTKTFLTKADADAAMPLPYGTPAQVTNDPDPDNNGYWVSDGSQWIWSGLQPVGSAELNAVLREFTDSVMLQPNQPNLLTLEQSQFHLLPRVLNGAAARDTSTGTISLNINSDENGTARVVWSVPAAAFKTGKISAQLTILSANAGTGGTIRVYQRDGSRQQVAQATLVGGVVGPVTVSTTYSAGGIAIHEDAVNVELDIALTNSSGSRQAYIYAPMLADGENAVYRLANPEPPPTLSFFPNPKLTADGATTYQATPTTFDGEYGAEMTTSATQQIIYEMPARFGLQAGDTVTLRAQLYSDVSGNNTSTDMSIIAVNSGGSVIGSTPVTGLTQANAWELLEQSVKLPVGTATLRLRFVKRNTATLGRVRRVSLVTDNAQANVIQTASSDDTPSSGGVKTIYISADGDDSNDGSQSAPVRTPTRAMELHNSGDTILFASDSDYEDIAGFNIAGKGEITIMAARNVRARFLLGTKLGTITKTVGQTKVYQAALATAPLLWVWQHDVPDLTTEIPFGERLSYQRGRQYRLTSTRIEQAASIADIDSSPAPKWYWESGTLYFSVSQGGSAIGAHIRVPRGGASSSGVYGGSGSESLTLQGINVLYADRDGINGSNVAKFKAVDCSGNFGGFNGISYDEGPNTTLDFCETAGNRGDGDNGHRLQSNPEYKDCLARIKHTWSHDNYDDGSSMHENFIGTYIAGLLEYNGDRGIATSYGAHASAYGTVCRYNGQYDPSGGEGFSAIGTIDPDADPGVGTQMDCYNTQSYGNRINYRATNGHSMTLHQCSSRDPIADHYRAETGGLITLIDCTHSGPGTVKAGGGTFVVENTDKVT